VAKVTPFLNAEPSIERWDVDIKDPRKLLTVSGPSISADIVRHAVEKSGFRVLGSADEAPVSAPSLKTYYPLILIFFFLVGAIVLRSAHTGIWERNEMMMDFMGGFFLVFSFFKLLNLPAFATAYQTYDIVAKAIPAYGFIYPFLELALGAAYISRFALVYTNSATLLLMALSAAGVLQALRKKTRIQCACLGTVFNLPMTKVTLFEDLLMVAMAAFMLAVAY
jgi:hypothetical protein